MSDSSGYGNVWWDVVQNEAAVHATMSSVGTAGRCTGDLSGSLTGPELSFLIAIRCESFPDCSATARGSATVSGRTLVGALSGTNSCFGDFSGGHIELRRCR